MRIRSRCGTVNNAFFFRKSENKNPSIGFENPINIHALLTKREVKMAGYWPSFFFAFLGTEVKVHKNSKRK